MKLKYRGVAYECNPTHVATVEGKVGGKYRGIPWQQKISQITQVDRPSVDLKYRGVPYRKNTIKLTNVETSPGKAAVTHPKMLPPEKPLSESIRPKVKH